MTKVVKLKSRFYVLFDGDKFGAYPCFLYICNMEERHKHIVLYKSVIGLLKVIPVLLAFTSLLNTILSYFDIDVPLLSYLGGISILPLIFLYLSSYAFRFCEYHRMFLHYVTINWALNIIDYYIGIPLSDRDLFLLYMIITGISLFVILYLYRIKR